MQKIGFLGPEKAGGAGGVDLVEAVVRLAHLAHSARIGVPCAGAVAARRVEDGRKEPRQRRVGTVAVCAHGGEQADGSRAVAQAEPGALRQRHKWRAGRVELPRHRHEGEDVDEPLEEVQETHVRALLLGEGAPEPVAEGRPERRRPAERRVIGEPFALSQSVHERDDLA